VLYRFSVLALAVAAVIAPASAATVPAITAFEETFAKVNDYTVIVHAHETLGDQTQDRTYRYMWKRPHLVKTLILSGPGAGGGAVWTGSDTVSGHQGGILSFIHLTVGLHDSRATSLRGYTIPDGVLQNQVAKYTTIKGILSERNGPLIGGQETTLVELKIAQPSPEPGMTRAVIYFSKATHLPLAQIRWAGDKIISQESWTDLRTNAGLKDSDF
jgi:outer membrane lipoprotein-sorting protein